MEKFQKNDFKTPEAWADAVLNSLDGAERASAGPFFYTRLSARMERENEPWERAANWISRPVFALAGVALFLSVNIWVFLKGEDAARKEMVQKALHTEQLLAAEFSGGNAYTLVETNEEK